MIDRRGRVAEAGEAAHIAQLIEQVLFTAPGERVNRPDFGTGLLQLVFAPGGEELATAAEFLVHGALQQWLGDLIELEAVGVELDGAALRVSVQYVLRRDRRRQTASFVREVPQ
jgi:phage baseplate assembly protein W